VGKRWTADQVLQLASDASSAHAGRKLARPAPWSAIGARADPEAVWGLCQGSGSKPYQTVVDLGGPAYRCSCPSRKFPCKHALGLLLLWSSGQVPDAAEPADFAAAWLASRRGVAVAGPGSARERGTSDQAGRGKPAPKGAPEASNKARRAARVAAGLEELDQWLRDQIRTGLAGIDRAGYGHFDQAAARMVDAQAPGVASTLRRLPAVAASGEGWPGRLVEEYARLRLLIVAHRRLGELAEPLAATVRSYVGYLVSREEVLARAPVHDRWAVLGLRDAKEERLTTRRVWLHGLGSGRAALVLTFAAAGQRLDASLVPGTTVEADLHFYPGAMPLRALVGRRRSEPGPFTGPAGGTVADALAGYAAALAADPWLLRWPVLIAAAVPVPGEPTWHLVDDAADALPLASRPEDLWRLLAVSGGHPIGVLGEWTGAALIPVAAFGADWVVAL